MMNEDGENGLPKNSHAESLDGPSGHNSSHESTVNRLARVAKVVRQFRNLMFAILVVLAVVIAVLVFIYMERVEKNEFEKDFQDNGNKVINSFSEDSYRKMQVLSSLSNTWTGYALHSNSTWPFVTVPHSAQEMGPFLSLADAAALTVFPIVPAHLRAEWEAYAVQNQHWIDEDLDASTSSSDGRNVVTQENENATISPYIKNYVGVDTSPGVWLPWWQYAPVINNRWFVNFNRLAWRGFPDQLKTLLQAKATLSETVTFVPGLDFQSTRDYSFFDQLLQAGGSGEYNPGEPLSYLFYPILQDFSENSPVVAVLSATVYWKSYFQDILPDSAKGIVCVVHNSAGQAFTYQVNGRSAEFLGMDDLHDTQYDHMKLTADYSNFGTNDEGYTKYTGVPVDNEHTIYYLDVYPSTLMRDDHFSNDPIYFALIMAAVFVVCAFIFVVYNILVERRQQLVMKTAVLSTTVVESMFPSNVRDRIMSDVAAPKSAMASSGRGAFLQGKNASSTWKSKKQVQIKSNKDLADGDLSSTNSSTQQSKPIADHFEGCTVLFADIKSFTSWCAAREPWQVFLLLETIYGAFDKIAKRHRVYKVETIGDCYMAVTGLPKANRQHALLMCQFSRDMLKKFHEIIKNLEQTLGKSTNQLGLRIGINSGPVTAGVIRGDNARFQLFGDTVNTAARMESTGVGGKIQISQDTADLLQKEELHAWYSPREETVFAKGKGEMQTYWLQASFGEATSRTTSNDDDDSPSGCSMSRLEKALSVRIRKDDGNFESTQETALPSQTMTSTDITSSNSSALSHLELKDVFLDYENEKGQPNNATPPKTEIQASSTDYIEV